MRRLLYLLVALVLAMPSAWAQSDGGTTSPFTLGAGARDLSLGGSDLVESDAATAPFWHTARLGRVERYTLAAFHSRLYESGVGYSYLGIVVPTLDLGTFALGVFRLGVDGIDGRNASNVSTGTFSDKRLRFYFAYGISLARFDLGAAVSLEHHSLQDYKATSSPGVDLSVGRRWQPSAPAIDHFTVGLNVRHLVQPSTRLADESLPEPRQFEAGISLGVMPKPEWRHVAALTASMTKVDNVDPRWAAGLEYRVADLLKLRGGVRDGNWAGGAGLQYKGIGFDYGIVGRDFGSLHMFTITTSFGKSTSERRAQRSERQETRFRELMRSQLDERNRTTVTSLVLRGDELIGKGDLAAAADQFDRALFVARSSGVDTSQIVTRLETTRAERTRLERQGRLEANLDSARVRGAQEDFLGARYFAQRALELEPGSPEAADLLAAADAALRQEAARARNIEEGLRAVDSLLNYGRVERAHRVAQALLDVAPEDPDVRAAVRRTHFEDWRARASAAYADSDWPAAQAALDSALQVYPGHEWCINLRDQIFRLQTADEQTAQVVSPSPGPVSEELRKDVTARYAAAQEAFERGDLETAIDRWEEVERLVPGFESVRAYLVRAYKFVGVERYGQNRLEDALDAWSRAAALEPDNTEISGYMRRAQNELRRMRELSYEP